jgi:hypothetical protein
MGFDLGIIGRMEDWFLRWSIRKMVFEKNLRA